MLTRYESHNGSAHQTAGPADPSELQHEVAGMTFRERRGEDSGGHVFTPPRGAVLRQEVTLAIEKAILLGAIAPGQRSEVSNSLAWSSTARAEVRS